MTILEHLAENVEKIKPGHLGTSAFIKGEIARCISTQCEYCDLNELKCKKILNWLLSEYNPQPTITPKEKKFLDFMKDDTKISRTPTGLWAENTSDSLTITVNLGILFKGEKEMFLFIDEKHWTAEELRELEVRE